MLIDLRELPDGGCLKADLCIVGGGAAGLALARELAGEPFSVCLLESGGLRKERQVEMLSRGENVGPYPLDLEKTRLRCLGGATNHWGGNSAPFDTIDFEDRPWVPGSGWPLTLAELRPYYRRTQALCGLPEAPFDAASWSQRSPQFAAGLLPLAEAEFESKVFQRNPLSFADALRASIAGPESNVTGYLHASALRLETTPEGDRVQRLHVGCLPDKRFTVEAGSYVLAAGIENARLLLLSRRGERQGIGNEHDNVGRFLMVHLNFFSGLVVPQPPHTNLGLYSVHTDMKVRRGKAKAQLAGLRIADSAQRRLGILNYVAFLADVAHIPRQEVPHVRTHVKAVRRRWKRRGHRAALLRRGVREAQRGRGSRRQWLRHALRPRLYAIRNWVEQAPRPENRITLGEGRDPFGMPKLRVDWRIGELEKRTVGEAQAALAHALRRGGLGWLFSDLPPVEDVWPEQLARASHFMGSTRMSRSPRDGVVDERCRVHGVKNLYVAGGSVLPTGGATMVTFNLLALALRLADDLKREFVRR